MLGFFFLFVSECLFMAVRDEDRSFLDFITDETCQDAKKEKTDNTLSFSDYFNSKKGLGDGPIKESKNLTYNVSYVDNFYRLMLNSKIIDFPANWGPFSEEEALAQEKVYTKESDEYALLGLLSHELGSIKQMTFKKDTEQGSEDYTLVCLIEC